MLHFLIISVIIINALLVELVLYRALQEHRGGQLFSFGKEVKTSCRANRALAWATRARKHVRLAGEPARSHSAIAVTTAAGRGKSASSAEAEIPNKTVAFWSVKKLTQR